MKNVSQLDLIKNCTGCMACYNICPINAIRIIQNEYGFYNPVITNDCIKCGKCLNVCQITKDNNASTTSTVLACKSKNDLIRMNASSGGVFPMLCYALNKQYGDQILFVGAKWSEGMQVIHKLETFDNVSAFSGSKYVQSYLGTTYREIEDNLRSGKYVLFSGTGCQVFALKLFLKERSVSLENLFIIDIVCHGVPSPKIWQDYIKNLEDKLEDNIVSYSFRNKQISWHGIHPVIKTANNKNVNNDDLVLSYGRLFDKLSLNMCCHMCKFSNLKRGGDITIGDFWGCEKSCPDLYDEKGVSLCLVNSEKGNYLIDLIREASHIVSVEGDAFLQQNLKSPTPQHFRTSTFWDDYTKRGYSYVAKKYTSHGVILRCGYKLINFLRKKAK